MDKQGNILGQHRGIAFYTIGQREGLGIAKGYPLHITNIDYKNNRITVGKKEDAYKYEFSAKDVHFILRPINPVRKSEHKLLDKFNLTNWGFLSNGAKKKVVVRVRIRYNHKEALAEVMPDNNKIKVRFRKAQFAITPGQSAVFYDKNTVFGGGIIDRVIR